MIPASGRSPGEGNGNPLQYSCLENPMDRGACRLQSMGSQDQSTEALVVRVIIKILIDISEEHLLVLISLNILTLLQSIDHSFPEAPPI